MWTGALRMVIGLDDGAFALTPGVGWAPRGNVTLNVDARRGLRCDQYFSRKRATLACCAPL